MRAHNTSIHATCGTHSAQLGVMRCRKIYDLNYILNTRGGLQDGCLNLNKSMRG